MSAAKDSMEGWGIYLTEWTEIRIKIINSISMFGTQKKGEPVPSAADESYKYTLPCRFWTGCGAGGRDVCKSKSLQLSVPRKIHV